MSIDSRIFFRALLAQAEELNQDDLRERPVAVAQQLLYQARIGSNDLELAEAAEERLRHFYAWQQASLATRWATGERQENSRLFEGAISNLSITESGQIVFTTNQEAKKQGCSVLWKWALPDVDQRLTYDLCRPNPVGEINQPFSALDIDPDASTAITGDLVGDVVSWDLKGRKEPRRLGCPDVAVISLSLSSDGIFAVSATQNGKLFLWNLDDDSQPEELTSSLGVLAGIAIVDSKRLAILCQDGRVLVKSLQDPDGSVHEIGAHESGSGMAPSLIVSRDGRSVVSIGRDNRLLRCMLDGTGMSEIGRASVPLSCIAELGDGCVVAGDVEGWVSVFSQGEGSSRRIGHHPRIVTAIAATEDNRIVSGDRDGHLMFWHADSDSIGTAGARPNIHHISVDRAAKEVLVGGYDGLFSSELANGQSKFTPFFSGESVVCFARLPVGNEVVISVSDGRLQVCDMETEERITVREAGESTIRCIAAIPEERAFLTGCSDGRVEVWRHRIDDWEATLLGTHEGEVTALATAPDGSAITADSEGYLWFRDLLYNNSQYIIGKTESSIRTMIYMADWDVVLSGDESGCLRRWRIQRLEKAAVSELVGMHRVGAIRDLVVSLDGAWIASAGADGAICCWNPWVQNGEEPNCAPPLARLITRSSPWRLALWGEFLLVASRNGVFTLLELLLPSHMLMVAATGQRELTGIQTINPDKAPTPGSVGGSLVLADQYWLKSNSGKLNFLKIREELRGGSDDIFVLGCPAIEHLMGFRHAAVLRGWTLLDTPQEPFARIDSFVGYLKALPSHVTTTVITGDPAVLSKLRTAGIQANVIDNVERYSM